MVRRGFSELSHRSIFICRVAHSHKRVQGARRWPDLGQHHLAFSYAAGELYRARRRANPFLSPRAGVDVPVIKAGSAGPAQWNPAFNHSATIVLALYPAVGDLGIPPGLIDIPFTQPEIKPRMPLAVASWWGWRRRWLLRAGFRRDCSSNAETSDVSMKFPSLVCREKTPGRACRQSRIQQMPTRLCQCRRAVK